MAEKKKILIVEDEFIIALDIQDTLKSMGYDTMNHILTGKKALDKVNSYKPDLVLLDIFLKDDITGLDVAETLNKKKIPFVFLTASANDSILNQAKKLKPVDIISKPITTGKMKDFLNKVFA
jgi:CheY-like chemotaxis protein